ncbi:type IX secretion system sortase PorU [Flavobacterium coralii]|uniref:type IX secretion system sortase PorU n=1 Tax=Flavobacterium coralii TaxID=2838017 RepID=UPI001F00E038|nr:type IX secretion system sortase PorU [Flavobacterium coralii]
MLSATVFGQQSGTVELVWKESQKVSFAETDLQMPTFQQDYMGFDFEDKQLLFTYKMPAPAVADPNSLTVTNVVYENINPTALGDIDRSKVPVKLDAVVNASKARNTHYATIKLNPIIKEGNSYKRVKSFSYSFSYRASAEKPKSTNDFNNISNSVLAAGEWYRFYVEKSGVYRLSKSFLQQLGLDVNADPRRIKIYGNGGRMLPLLNSADYPADLAENAIMFVGEQDGQFDNSDYILFYAEGVDNFSRENGTHNNLYANRSYYYVTSYGGNGKRINAVPQPSGTPVITTTQFDEYVYHERDLVSIARLGRKWHGEAFDIEDEQEFDFTVPDIVPGEAKITVRAAANSLTSTSMGVTVNGQTAGTINFGAVGSLARGVDGTLITNFNASAEDITVALSYNNNGVPTSDAWLDYIAIECKRSLRGGNGQFRFRYNDAANNIGVIEYQFTGAGDINAIWDITDIYNAAQVAENSSSQFAFRANMGEVREYITVTSSGYLTPLRESNTRVANQNLKGTIFNNAQGQFQDVEYLIITPEFLRNQAEELAGIHRTNSGMVVKVVTLEKIYQEFASGKQDIGAIRNFIKYVYNNASSDDNRVKYVNLFGDASFDFKDRIPNNTNIVPIFHYYNETNAGSSNYSEVSTFATDEFFVLMDPTEGRIAGDSEEADIAVGRMLVSSTQQAREMVNKIAEYLGEESYGRWRNEYTLVADDADTLSDVPFTSTQDTVANQLNDFRPFVNVRKIYTDSFVQQVSSGGERYPDAKDQLIRSINYGTLVVNYLGHGSENGMASERMLESADAQVLTNRYKYPLFVTATCDLTKFDNPYRQTAGEFIYWNPQGGAIAMITTTRAIFTISAYNFNKDLSERLYAFNLPEYPTMAEAFRLTKVQASSSTGYRVIAFVGDPALKLAVPKPKIVLTHINDVPVAENTAPIRALDYVALKGQVTTEGGAVLTNYNGDLEITVFDKEVQRQTLNNDNNTPNPYLFSTLGETVFRGSATVTNGQFEVGFVVPRDIRIAVGNGRVSFYAKRNNILEDQTGHDNDILIGGINENAAEDRTAPSVRLYMNDESFVSGGITNDSPMLLAFLEDEHGINTASGIGHDIIGILDGDENNPFLMNDYYEADPDTYKRGKVRFPFANLEKGLHTLTFKAWDVYNNLVTADIQFVVSGDDALTIDKVLNYPNPFVSYTEFWFNHNRPFEPLDVQVQIFTVSGKVVKTINQSVITDGFLSRDIRWDGRDDFGDKIGKGVYVYKLTVRSTVTNKTAYRYEKLVLL